MTRGAFLVHGGFAVISIAFTLLLGIETKGRGLEDIHVGAEQIVAEERTAVFASSGRGALAAHKHSGLR